MKLYELQPAEGSVKDVKRIGRGHGSGNGKTAGKGFEGGQMPLQRRIPKRGFHNIFAVEYATVNVSDLEARFENGAVVDAAALVESGAIKNAKDGIKILGNGELTKSLLLRQLSSPLAHRKKLKRQAERLR